MVKSRNLNLGLGYYGKMGIYFLSTSKLEDGLIIAQKKETTFMIQAIIAEGTVLKNYSSRR